MLTVLSSLTTSILVGLGIFHILISCFSEEKALVERKIKHQEARKRLSDAANSLDTANTALKEYLKSLGTKPC